MTTKPIDDGGPAFPVVPQLGPARPGEWASAPIHPGMSIRVWLAGMAMAGLMQDSSVACDSKEARDHWAKTACQLADAMIAALKNRGAE